jgi:hypothetical protein
LALFSHRNIIDIVFAGELGRLFRILHQCRARPENTNEKWLVICGRCKLAFLPHLHKAGHEALISIGGRLPVVVPAMGKKIDIRSIGAMLEEMPKGLGTLTAAFLIKGNNVIRKCSSVRRCNRPVRSGGQEVAHAERIVHRIAYF